MSNLQSLNTAFMRPIFSPRSEMSRYLNDIERNKTNLIINIDKQTLSLFKNQFEYNQNKLDKITFITTGLKILNSWQKQLPYRQSRIITYLMSLFEEIQDKISGTHISWQQFNNLIIEKALNLKSLQTHDIQSLSQLKPINWSKHKIRLQTPVQKIICINNQKKIAYLCEQSNKIQFYNILNNQQNYRPLVLDRHDLLVQKSLVKRVKQQDCKITKQNYKKQVVVSGYTVTFIDMIYISSQKYQMLITSSTDGLIRGWDIHGSVPALAKQPQNQQQKMIHQFSEQIHCMVWDQVNDILYCSSKNNKIYLWIVKTDSQKQLTDIDGHHSMISSMIMMPKLQFLATGDYEGKLILWDTISMNKKYKYQQHTRSIVSMTFHQSLILLFTASFDHSICVWNPYIPSLIYKISCNLNVLQVHIIPGTNYLAALDTASNVKIREINKFNLVSTYVVDRPDDGEQKIEEGVNQGFYKIQPSCMAVSESPIRFFFGGHSIKCTEFDQNQALSAGQFYPTFLKYSQQKMRLYVVIKNLILIWDILTGQLHDILQSQSQQQITSIQLIPNSSRFIIGDSHGSIYLRKLQNGIKISKIYKHKQKVAINHLICKKGGIWNQCIIIGYYQDCEIVVFGKDQSSDYTLLRTFNPRRNYPNIFIISIEYEEKRNILILGTNNGDIICMDVDKNRVINHIQTKNLQAIQFIIKPQIPNLLTFGKNSQIFGIYLPPHSKKFKPSCNLSIQNTRTQQKVVAISMSKQNKCYIGYQNGIIKRIQLNNTLTNNQSLTKSQHNTSPSNPNINTNLNATTKINQNDNNDNIIQVEWQIKLSQLPKDMILIVNQTILAIILYMKNITLLNTQNGQIINILPNYSFSGRGNFYEYPLCYYGNGNNQRDPVGDSQNAKDGKEGKHQLYIPETKKYYPLQILNKSQISQKPTKNSLNINNQNILRTFHDPYFLYEEYMNFVSQSTNQPGLKRKQTKQVNFSSTIQTSNNIQSIHKIQQQNKKILWNKQWKIQPQFRELIKKKFAQLLKVQAQSQQYLSKPAKRMVRNNSVSGVSQVQRAVQAQKQWERVKQQLEEQVNKSKTKLISSSNFKYPTVYLQKKQSKGENRQQRDSDKSVLITKHKSLYKNQSSPFIRLGLALQKINEKDQKAMRFIQMGENKNTDILKSLKLPRIKTKEKN